MYVVAYGDIAIAAFHCLEAKMPGILPNGRVYGTA